MPLDIKRNSLCRMWNRTTYLFVTVPILLDSAVGLNNFMRTLYIDDTNKMSRV
jgi:hypothetical protein